MIAFVNDLSEIARKRGLADFAADLEILSQKHRECPGHVAAPQGRPVRNDGAGAVLPFAQLRGER
ncbi:hypothetical protein [Wenxinia marina]|nr:hypothetical protein [Wenxinia marina]